MIKAKNGIFYGTTIGGEIDLGTVFSVSGDGALATLHSFHGADGDYPYGQLVEADDGNLYGTTIYGGPTSNGVAFRLTPQGVFTILHNFGSSPLDGTHPWGGVVQGKDGNFYGTTFDGGSNGVGTVYRMTPEGEVTIVHDFAAARRIPQRSNLDPGT